MRSQTRSANHHMSCRRSRKFLCDPGNPLIKILQVLNVNFTVLYVKFIDLPFFKLLSWYFFIFKIFIIFKLFVSFLSIM